jgi:hypothetical protein
MRSFIALVATFSAASADGATTSLVLSPSSAASAGGQPVTTTWSLSAALQRKMSTATKAHRKLVDPHHNTFARWLDDGLWLGMFPEGADVSPIPDIVWPATGPLTATSPWRYIALDEVAAGNNSNSFAWSMDSKVRGNVDFVLFSNGYDTPVEEARATLALTDAEAPGQVRLARTEQLSQVRVQWNEAAAEPGRVVWWLEEEEQEKAGAEEEEEERDGAIDSQHQHQEETVVAEAEGTPRTLTREDFCGVPATTAGWLDPGFTHDVVIDLSVAPSSGSGGSGGGGGGGGGGGVAPGTVVHYRVESASGGTAGPFNFAAPRGGGDTSGSNRFLLLADMGCTYEVGSYVFPTHSLFREYELTLASSRRISFLLAFFLSFFLSLAGREPLPLGGAGREEHHRPPRALGAAAGRRRE